MVRASNGSSISYDRKSKHKDDADFTGVDFSLRDRPMVIPSDKVQKEFEKEKSNDNQKKEDFEGVGEEDTITSSEYEDEVYYADIDASPVAENSIYRYSLPKISLTKSYPHKNASLPDLSSKLDKNMNTFLVYDGIPKEPCTASPVQLLQSLVLKRTIETSNSYAAEINSSGYNDDTVPYPDFRDDLNVLSANQAIDCLNSAEEIKKKENAFNDIIPTLMSTSTKQKVEDYLNSTETQQRYTENEVYPPIQSLTPLSELSDFRSTHKDVLHFKSEELATSKQVDPAMRNKFKFKKFNIMMISLLAFNLIIQILAILLYILNILPESIEFIHLFFFCLVLNFFMFFSILVHQGQLKLTEDQW